MTSITSPTNPHIKSVVSLPDRRTREAVEELADLDYVEGTRGSNNLLSFRLSSMTGTPPYNSSNLLHPDALEAQWNSV